MGGQTSWEVLCWLPHPAGISDHTQRPIWIYWVARERSVPSRGFSFFAPFSRIVSRWLILLDCLTLSSSEHFKFLDSGCGRAINSTWCLSLFCWLLENVV